jgi:hypothetical protein
MSVISNFVKSNPAMFSNATQTVKPATSFDSVLDTASKTVSKDPEQAKQAKRQVVQDATNVEVKSFFDKLNESSKKTTATKKDEENKDNKNSTTSANGARPQIKSLADLLAVLP